MKSVAVVGAGFAGLAAALELARSGVRVTVLEAHAHAGGRAEQLREAGFTFDSGPTLLVMTDALRSALGEEAFASLALRRLEPGYRVTWPGGERFEMHSDIAEFLDEFARFEGTNRRSAALAYLACVHEQYVQARAKILEVDHTPLSFARALLSPGRFAPWSLGKLQPFVRRYVRNPRVQEAMTFQPLYLGMSPLRSPAMYALLAVEEIVGGVWYAPGGTGAVVRALVRECERAGVRFAYGTTVRNIHVNGKAAVTFGGSSAAYFDGIVVTADREVAMERLFGAPSARRRLRYGHSAMLWYLGVRGSLPLPHHTVMLPQDTRSAYEALDRGALPDDPLVYACNPVVSDAAVAPAGFSALMLLAPVPNARALPQFDERALRERVLARVERETGPIAGRIVYERTRSPRDFASKLHLAHGAAFGPDHALDQMGPFRPAIRHSRFGNVVFAGSGTRPGSGVPMVLISGRLAAQRLLEHLA